MANYMNGFIGWDVRVTTPAFIFTERVWARTSEEALTWAKRKWGVCTVRLMAAGDEVVLHSYERRA